MKIIVRCSLFFIFAVGGGGSSLAADPLTNLFALLASCVTGCVLNSSYRLEQEEHEIEKGKKWVLHQLASHADAIQKINERFLRESCTLNEVAEQYKKKGYPKEVAGKTLSADSIPLIHIKPRGKAQADE